MVNALTVDRSSNQKDNIVNFVTKYHENSVRKRLKDLIFRYRIEYSHCGDCNTCITVYAILYNTQ